MCKQGKPDLHSLLISPYFAPKTGENTKFALTKADDKNASPYDIILAYVGTNSGVFSLGWDWRLMGDDAVQTA